MNSSNGGYGISQATSDNVIHQHRQSHNRYSNDPNIQERNLAQEWRNQSHQANTTQAQPSNTQGSSPHISTASSVSFNKDEEAMRLLQQLASEQSELLERLHVVNTSIRPTEQYLTIALNGK